MDNELLSINILPIEIENTVSNISTYESVHTPYRDEIRLFSCVKQGDEQKLYSEMVPLFSKGIFVGEMSPDDVRQFRYMAVSTITLAVRYAIQGGLAQKTAYGFSDEFIRTIDNFDTTGEIAQHIAVKVVELTRMVKENREKIKHSPRVRKAVEFINTNVSKKLTVKDIAKTCNVSPDYLSHIFKKEMGESLSTYILKRKLDLSQTLLWEGISVKDVCEALSFCSASYFVSCFKKEYGMTPKEYVSQIK